jgi:hypothetical protein
MVSVSCVVNADYQLSEEEEKQVLLSVNREERKLILKSDEPELGSQYLNRLAYSHSPFILSRLDPQSVFLEPMEDYPIPFIKTLSPSIYLFICSLISCPFLSLRPHLKTTTPG